jgi:uncharacterized membrane protein
VTIKTQLTFVAVIVAVIVLLSVGACVATLLGDTISALCDRFDQGDPICDAVFVIVLVLTFVVGFNGWKKLQ